MKKQKLIELLLAAVLTVFAAAPALAEEAVQAEAKAKMSVYVDGMALSFEVDPFIVDGTTLVPFRAIFEKLGLTIGWDDATQTVSGSSENLKVEMMIGSTEASVNGKKVDLEVAPQLAGEGTTMIPLRFVGEAAGRDVNWDGYTSSVWIGSAEDNVKRVALNNIKYTQAEDLKGLVSTIDTSNPTTQTAILTLRHAFALYDLKYEINDVQVLSSDGDTAEVRTTATVRKVSGPDFKDNKTTQVNTLRKMSGSWVVSKGKVEKIDYLLADKFKDEQPKVSDEVKKAVQDVLDKETKYTVTEDFDSLKMLYAPDYPNLEQDLAQLKMAATSFDIEIDSVESTIIQASSDKVLLKYSGIITMTGAGQTKQKATSVMTLQKQTDGSWKISADDTLYTEILE
jgi:hypothetical protein